MSTRYIPVRRASTLPEVAAEDLADAAVIVQVEGAGARRTTHGAIQAASVAAASAAGATAGAEAEGVGAIDHDGKSTCMA
jgi:hypothetical protein